MANNLKQIRMLRNISQVELAEKLNVSRQAIGMWEKTENINIIPKKRLKEIAQILDVQENDIISENFNEDVFHVEVLQEKIQSLSQQLLQATDYVGKEEVVTQLNEAMQQERIAEARTELEKVIKDDLLKLKNYPLNIVIDFLKVINSTRKLNSLRSLVSLLVENDKTKLVELNKIVKQLTDEEEGEE